MRNLHPQCVWKHFHTLTQTPRPSGHLDKVRAMLLRFAADAGIEAFEDSAGNIVMSKPASPGRECRRGVILQAHIDMVPQKANDSTHDFLNDPIQTWVDGDWLRARGTTLGADNGLGVAAIMAVMEDKTLRHGPLQALLTADEETGMSGVKLLPNDELHGDILLNLDTEQLGMFVIGSAGAVDINAEMHYTPTPSNPSDTAICLSLRGLLGGHSGLEIHLGRANANKLMARVLREATATHGARLAHWRGGNMRNAIPFEADALITIAKDKVQAIKTLAEEFQATFRKEFEGIDPGITIAAEETERPQTLLPKAAQDSLVGALLACHDGVLRMFPSIPDVVETSSNLSIVALSPEKAHVEILARSSVETMQDYLARSIESCLSMAGMSVSLEKFYQGWDPNPQSEALKLLMNEYREVCHDEPTATVEHAGLECSVILSHYPHLDIVSLGPTMLSPHTTNERCFIPSVAPFWRLLTKTLEDI